MILCEFSVSLFVLLCNHTDHNDTLLSYVVTLCVFFSEPLLVALKSKSFAFLQDAVTLGYI